MGECMELYTPGACPVLNFGSQYWFSLFSKKSSQDGSDLSLWSGQIRCLV